MPPNDPLTEAELAAIVARAEAASPGPWDWDARGEYHRVGVFRPGMALGGFRGERMEENGAFVAHAREDVPRLVADVRRLRKALSAELERRHGESPCMGPVGCIAAPGEECRPECRAYRAIRDALDGDGVPDAAG